MWTVPRGFEAAGHSSGAMAGAEMSEQKYIVPRGLVAFFAALLFTLWCLSQTPWARKDSKASILLPMSFLLWREYSRQKAEETKLPDNQ
jgi:hypothetical protein